MAFLRQRGKKQFYSIIDEARNYTEPLKTNNEKLATLALKQYEAKKFLESQGLQVPGEKKSGPDHYQKFKEKFLSFAKENRAYRTYIKIEYVLGKFQEIIKPDVLSGVDPIKCEEYQTARLKDGLAMSTVFAECAYLSSAFKKAVRWKLIQENPWEDVEKLEPQKKQPKSFHLDEQEKALRAFKEEADLRRNPYIYIGALLALRMGLRISEIVHLRREDINLKRLEIYLRSYECGCYYCAEGNGMYEIKNRKEDTIPLEDEELLDLLKKTYQPLGKGPLCVFTISGFQKLTRRILEREKIYTPRRLVHAFRHSTAMNLLEAGVNIRAIQRFLRHEHLSSTEIYTNMHDDQFRRELSKFKPPAVPS